MDNTFTIILADGTELKNLVKNGDNFISKTEISKDLFEGNCHSVIIKSSEFEEKHYNMELIQIVKMNEEYWFVLRELSETEIKMAEMSANIDFLAMMNDVEL